MSATSREELRRRLEQYMATHPLPGLSMEASRFRFVEELLHSERKFRARCLRKFGGSADPSKEDFRPLKAIVEHFDSGNRDEALWLSFLTILFGIDVPETIRDLYGKFGNGCWSWRAVGRNPQQLQDWMRENRSRMMHLRFGNHRKREIMNTDHPRGTSAVIRSFVGWVNDKGGGSPFHALESAYRGAKGPEEKFDVLYRDLQVLRFGRTAQFDFLCLVGNLGILKIAPGHCYLKGATGPKQGALLMTTGDRKGKLSERIEFRIKELQCYIDVSVEAMEDALCNWQKRATAQPACKVLAKRPSGCQATQ